MKIIDISTDLLTAEVFEGDPKPKLERVKSISPESYYNLSTINACLHNGTHVDAPLHFLIDGDSVEKYNIETFIGSCTVLEVAPGIITGQLVENSFPRDCKRLLLKSRGKAYIHQTAAEIMSFLGYELIGTDGNTIEEPESNGATHRTLLSSNIAVIEGLNLSQVSNGEYFLIAPPVKICGAEASFTRALLVSDYIFWSGKKD